MAALTLTTQAGPLHPEFEHVVKTKRRGVRTEKDALSPRARQINERALRRYRLEWARGSLGQRTTLLAAHRDARGPVHPMNYTPAGLSDGSALEVRFVEDTLQIKRTGLNAYSMQVEVEEVR